MNILTINNKYRIFVRRVISGYDTSLNLIRHKDIDFSSGHWSNFIFLGSGKCTVRPTTKSK